VSRRLSPEAGTVLQEFYLELRNTHRNLDSTPLTTRLLESMIRLSEARAKVELRDVVTEQDALVGLMVYVSLSLSGTLSLSLSLSGTLSVVGMGVYVAV
jgi:DNA helicase MCM8